jgi:hypothetical protein
VAHIEIEGTTVQLAEDWRIGELIRAENALDIDMDSAKTAARTALVVYISLAREEPWKSRRDLADYVMRMDITELAKDDEEDDALPPVFVPDGVPSVPPGLSVAEEKDDPPTTGRLPSASSG